MGITALDKILLPSSYFLSISYFLNYSLDFWIFNLFSFFLLTVDEIKFLKRKIKPILRIFNLEKLFPSLSVYWIEEAGICLHLTVRKSCADLS